MRRDPVVLVPVKKKCRLAQELKRRQMYSKRLSSRAWATLSVGYAAAEGGDGFCFVGEGGDGLDQAREFEDFSDVTGGVQDFQAATLAFESDEGAHQSANARAINLRDAGKIHQDLGRASLGELTQFQGHGVVAGADDHAAL